jgi:Bacterial regulatory protein, Fis family
VADISFPLFASPSHAAALLGISRSSLYERIGAGDFIARKLGGRCCVDMTHAVNYMHNLPRADIRVGKPAA